MPGTPQAIIDGYSYDSFVKNWQSKELASGGIGSQVFGPVSTAIDTWSVPLVQTTATTTGGVSVSTYINSAGQQHSLFGFVIPDRGDASHLLNGNDAVKSPYRGTTAPDVNLDNGSGQGCERHPRARYIHTECHSGGAVTPNTPKKVRKSFPDTGAAIVPLLAVAGVLIAGGWVLVSRRRTH